VLFTLFACRPASVVVSVTDKQNLASSAQALAVGGDVDHLAVRVPLGGRAFPVTFALKEDARASGLVFVEARGSRDETLARGSLDVHFSADNTAVNEIDLGAPCRADAECDDEIFCDGQEQCLNRACRAAPFGPCPTNLPACIQAICVEADKGCQVVFDPRLEDRDPCTIPACSENGVVHVPDPSAEKNACTPAGGGPGICRTDAAREMNERAGTRCISMSPANIDGFASAGYCEPSTCGDCVIDPRTETCDSGGDTPWCDGCQKGIDVERITDTGAGPPPDDAIDSSFVSQDGSIVVFTDTAETRVNGDECPSGQTFVAYFRDRVAKTTRILCASTSGIPVALSGDGHTVIVFGAHSVVALSASATHEAQLPLTFNGAGVRPDSFDVSDDGLVVVASLCVQDQNGTKEISAVIAPGQSFDLPGGFHLMKLSGDGGALAYVPGYTGISPVAVQKLLGGVPNGAPIMFSQCLGTDPVRGGAPTVAISPNGRWLACATDDPALGPSLLFDLFHPNTPPTPLPYALSAPTAISSDGRFLFDGLARIEIATGSVDDDSSSAHAKANGTRYATLFVTKDPRFVLFMSNATNLTPIPSIGEQLYLRTY
jgi:hypothetical protein